MRFGYSCLWSEHISDCFDFCTLPSPLTTIKFLLGENFCKTNAGGAQFIPNQPLSPQNVLYWHSKTRSIFWGKSDRNTIITTLGKIVILSVDQVPLSKDDNFWVSSRACETMSKHTSCQKQKHLRKKLPISWLEGINRCGTIGVMLSHYITKLCREFHENADAMP